MHLQKGMHTCVLFPLWIIQNDTNKSLRLIKSETFHMIVTTCSIGSSQHRKKRWREKEHFLPWVLQTKAKLYKLAQGRYVNGGCPAWVRAGACFSLEQDEGGMTPKVSQLPVLFSDPILREAKQINPLRLGDEKGCVRTEWWYYFYLHQLQACSFLRKPQKWWISKMCLKKS